MRAQRLQGEILGRSGRLADALRTLETSVQLATTLGMPREIWMGKATLGRILADVDRDAEAERSLGDAAGIIETIAGKITTAGLRRSFLLGEPVLAVYRALGRHAPAAE